MAEIILNKTELKKMGIKGNIFYLFSYDLPNKHDRDIKKGKQFTKEQIAQIRQIRNKLMFQLKFKIRAIKNLDSSWFISEDRLNDAKSLCEEIREDLKSCDFLKDSLGFNRYPDKVKIIPILTNDEGFETFEDRRAEFMLEFVAESLRKVDEGIKNQKMSESSLWRCKKAVEIIQALKDTLKAHKRYNEVVDDLGTLDDKINQYEAIKMDKKQNNH